MTSALRSSFCWTPPWRSFVRAWSAPFSTSLAGHTSSKLSSRGRSRTHTQRNSTLLFGGWSQPLRSSPHTLRSTTPARPANAFMATWRALMFSRSWQPGIPIHVTTRSRVLPMIDCASGCCCMLLNASMLAVFATLPYAMLRPAFALRGMTTPTGGRSSTIYRRKRSPSPPLNSDCSARPSAASASARSKPSAASSVTLAVLHGMNLTRIRETHRPESLRPHSLPCEVPRAFRPSGLTGKRTTKLRVFPYRSCSRDSDPTAPRCWKPRSPSMRRWHVSACTPPRSYSQAWRKTSFSHGAGTNRCLTNYARSAHGLRKP